MKVGFVQVNTETYQHLGPRFLVWLCYGVRQIELQMILVVLKAPTLVGFRV